MRSLRREAILEVYQFLLAIFLFVSPWLFAFAHGTVGVDTWLSAGLVVAISFLALVAFREWEEWINILLGLWISASPWFVGFQQTAAMRVNVAVGILIVYLAMLELWLIHYGPPPEHTMR